jgi:hypothetical protein
MLLFFKKAHIRSQRLLNSRLPRPHLLHHTLLHRRRPHRLLFRARNRRHLILRSHQGRLIPVNLFLLLRKLVPLLPRKRENLFHGRAGVFFYDLGAPVFDEEEERAETPW